MNLEAITLFCREADMAKVFTVFDTTRDAVSVESDIIFDFGGDSVAIHIHHLNAKVYLENLVSLGISFAVNGYINNVNVIVFYYGDVMTDMETLTGSLYQCNSVFKAKSLVELRSEKEIYYTLTSKFKDPCRLENESMWHSLKRRLSLKTLVQSLKTYILGIRKP
jgi:hypothetical protein